MRIMGDPPMMAHFRSVIFIVMPPWIVSRSWSDRWWHNQ